MKHFIKISVVFLILCTQVIGYDYDLSTAGGIGNNLPSFGVNGLVSSPPKGTIMVKCVNKPLDLIERTTAGAVLEECLFSPAPFCCHCLLLRSLCHEEGGLALESTPDMCKHACDDKKKLPKVIDHLKRTVSEGELNRVINYVNSLNLPKGP